MTGCPEPMGPRDSGRRMSQDVLHLLRQTGLCWSKGVRMAPSRHRRLPWTGDSPRETVVFAGAAIAALYVLLTPTHLLLLSGTPRTVMASVAAASALTAAALATAAHRRTLPAERLPVVLAIVAALPLVNSLTHTAVARELQQTAVTMLSIVAIAAVAHARLAVLSVAAALAAWAT